MPIPSGLSTAEAQEYIQAQLDYLYEIIAGLHPATFVIGIDEFYSRQIAASTLGTSSQTKVNTELAKIKDKHKDKGK